MKKLTSRNNLGRAFAVLLLLSVCLSASALPGPTGASYAWGAQLTVAGYDANKGTLTDFPVLVRISPETVSGFQYSQMLDSTTGSDLCFIDMSGNGLPFEIDTWDPQGTSLVWVTLPTMLQGSQFVMCWGGGIPGKTVCAANPFAGYYGVWHMNEANAKDSTPNHLDGTAAASVSVVAAKLGTGTEFPSGAANSTKIQTTNTLNSAFSSAISFETWACPYIDGSERALFGKEALATFKIKSGKTWFTTPGKQDFDKIGVSLTANTWYHIVLTFTPNQSAKLYINGELVKTQTDSKGFNNLGLSCPIVFGNNQWSQYYNGILDECRLLTTELSADWISASYATQSDAAFLTAGAATAYEASAEPQVGVVASDVQYTNATLTVTISSLGKNDAMTADASWVDATLLVATDDTFAAPVLSVPLARATSVPSSASMPAVSLVTNTTYYAKVVANNSFNVAGESGAVPFTTRNPGFATGTASFFARGFTTLSATGTTTDFGVGSASGTMRLEASADGFSTVTASAEDSATLDTPATFTVSGLTPDTTYALRFRLVNEWGLVTYVPVSGAYVTRDVPINTTGIGYVFAADGSTADFTFGVTEVFDGASCTATLVYDGRTLDEKAFSAAGTLAWSGVAAASGTKTATVTVTADVDGTTYTATWSLPVTPGTAAVSVSDVADHVSVATAVRLHVGDVLTLPELVGDASYTVMNGRFLSRDGNVLVALEPGIVGVKCVDTVFHTNTLAVLVLPEAIGSGSVYIYKETVATGDRVWTTAAAWDKVGAESNDSWPKNADDIAVIPFYQYGASEKYLRIKEDVTVGGLYYGSFRDTGNDKLVIERHKSVDTKTVSFERTDGEPAIVKICANTTGERQNQLVFGGYAHHTEYRTDTVLDAGWDGSANANCRGRFSVAAHTNTIPAGVTVSVVNFDRTGNSMGATMWPGRLEGDGVFWNRSSGTMRWDGGLENFTGTIRDSGGYQNASTDRCGPTYLRTGTCTNLAVEVVGQVGRSGGSPYTSWAGNAVGCLKTGWNHTHNPEPIHPETNWFPRTLTLHGGTLYRDPTGVKWGAGTAGGVRDLRCTKRLTVEGGLNNIGGNGTDNAISWLEADELVHGDKATIRIVDQSRADTASTATKTNEVTILHGATDYLVGAAGNPEESDVYPIIPWMVAPITAWDDSWDRYPFFACFDSSDRLIRPAYYNTALDGAKSEQSNAYVSDKTIQIGRNVTLNSLFLYNPNKNKYLGEGRTLTLSSGGLVLHGTKTAIGLPGRTDNGSLVLGDANHPGYVFAKSGSASDPNQIWAKVTAPGGFVAAYTGYLTLGGDQTGIGDELVVNAGTLTLGTAANGCSLAKDLPVRIYANATLAVPHENDLAGTILQFDGAAGWFGKVDLASNQRCRKLYVRDYPEAPEWENLVRGTYGCSGSSAEFIRDDLFTGTGVLTVLSDDVRQPTRIILF